MAKYAYRYAQRGEKKMYLGKRRENGSFSPLGFRHLWSQEGRQALSSFITQSSFLMRIC